jgi:uncharacterized membrane protein (DUF373 family)/hemoglobin-like flavoprotein
MSEMAQLLGDYKISSVDIENIKLAAPIIESNKERIADHHYDRLLTHKETARFFQDEIILSKARNAFIQWLQDLVSGDYSSAYYVKLNRVGGVHVKINLPAFHVNVQIAHVRHFVEELICEAHKDNLVMAAQINRSLGKLLDLNLDLMTRSYREEELKSNFLSYKLDSWLISIAKRFVNGFNIILVIGLVITGVLILGMFFRDLSQIAFGNVDRGVLGTLGTLLMLWVVIELLDTQIGHIKGHAFAIKVFVSVALVAELRKVLMSSIGHENWQENAVIISSVLVLGITYWLISKIDNR